VWEYAKFYKGTIFWLAARGLFADKSDAVGSDEAKAWSKLSEDGWELVSVVADADGQFAYFFKRPREEK
jgi:hypothetical protein